ncbi:hypothetical protein H5410_056893 [Solanum commersonii]|uniref:DUF7746 domain-containing protein n=1 Tax=Solanum commersonii TaxID=4109 RepID=A0A9J5WNK1_SOLCO|nr:hypothetical protein H5410_056893 [Solanum commersonii]
MNFPDGITDFTLSNGEITRSVFPPQQSFQINKNDKIVNFNAFSKLLENDTALVTVQHVNAIIKQNNYANIYMSILGEHIMSLHEKVDRLLTLLPTKVKGKEKVTHSSLQPPPDIEDFKIKDYSDLESFLEKKFKGGGVQPLNTDNFIEGGPSNKKEFYDSLNKISEKYARKPVQRIMLMYSTICKTNKNSDRTIADMINVFYGQLKGWWDNYLNQTQRDTVLMAVKQEGDQVTQNAVYTLVLNIIEHFSGRWSDNSETIRTLLQNLRCKSLTSFRYYKDVFLCRVMELPECNSTHWKSKFIDGLPTLFAERVRKSLRGDDHSINYDDYTYGKLISACVQEGLSLCNEIKLNQQIKRHRLTERKQLGEFCEQFAFDIPKQKSKDLDSSSHKKNKSSKKDYEKWKKKKIEKKLRRAYGHYAKDCRVKEKIKNLDIDDNLKDSLCKIMLNSDSESGSAYSSREYSSTSEDLKALQQEEYLTSEDECSPCQQGMACEKDDDGDDLYKIYEQFKELSLNVIDNDKVIELLQNIKDPEIRAQIIDKISDSKEKEHITEKDYIPKEVPTKEGSYTMAEVKNLLLERRKMISSPTTISDLKEEIDNLKEDIIRLKEKNVVIEVRLDAIQTLQNLNDKASESSSSMEGENDSLDFIKNIYLKNDKTDFLYSLKAFTSQKTLTSFNVSQTTASSSSGTSGGVDINHPMYKEFMDFMKSKKETSSSTTYSSVLIDDENIEVFDMNSKKEVILLLEDIDLRWRNEPWQIMTRYLDTVAYTATSYKYRMHYEIILSSTGCEFQHFYPANTKKVYNFSKLVVKRIISPEEWGMSTLKELDYIHPEQKVPVKYNYWDYIDGFNKVLLYENANRKHSWFIKLCAGIFDRNIPNWFCKWWTLYGPTIKILPESYKKLYLEWIDISPKLTRLQEDNIFFEGISMMYFFIEFSIPWIMRWSIEVNTTSEGFPCLQRVFYTKFEYYDTNTTESQVKDNSTDPFKKIARQLQMKRGIISKSEAIALYMEEVKRDLMKNLDFDIKDDASMASASHTDDTCLAGEGQDLEDEEEDLKTILVYTNNDGRIFHQRLRTKGKTKYIRQLGTCKYIVSTWQQCMKAPTIRVRPGPPSTWVIQRVIQRISSATFHKPAWLDYV